MEEHNRGSLGTTGRIQAGPSGTLAQEDPAPAPEGAAGETDFSREVRALADRSASTMKLEERYELVQEPDPWLLDGYRTRLLEVLEASRPEEVAALWQEAFADTRGQERGRRVVSLFAAARELARTGQAPGAVTALGREASQDLLAVVGYGSIMGQPSEPQRIVGRLFGTLPDHRRTSEIGAWRRGSSRENLPPEGPPFADEMDPDGYLAAGDRRHLFAREGHFMALGLGLSPSPGESVDVVVDLVCRRDEEGRSLEEEFLASYDAREGVRNPEEPGAPENFYVRTPVKVVLGHPDPVVEGFAYRTNPGGEFHRPGLTLSQAARRIIDATEEGPEPPRWSWTSPRGSLSRHPLTPPLRASCWPGPGNWTRPMRSWVKPQTRQPGWTR